MASSPRIVSEFLLFFQELLALSWRGLEPFFILQNPSKRSYWGFFLLMKNGLWAATNHAPAIGLFVAHQLKVLGTNQEKKDLAPYEAKSLI